MEVWWIEHLGSSMFGVAFINCPTAAAESLQSCPTLCDPTDGSPPGSPISGILQARTLEWVAISFSNAWQWKVKVKSLSHVPLFTTPWTAAHQAPPSMGFSRQEDWMGCHCLLRLTHYYLILIPFISGNQGYLAILPLSVSLPFPSVTVYGWFCLLH